MHIMRVSKQNIFAEFPYSLDNGALYVTQVMWKLVEIQQISIYVLPVFIFLIHVIH
jgi:hypothetical protein